MFNFALLSKKKKKKKGAATAVVKVDNKVSADQPGNRKMDIY